MNFSELAKSRYSVRKFDGKTVSADTMRKILETANAAPTGCNYQPQRIYVIESPEKIDLLNELSKCIFGAKTVLLFTLNTDEDWKNRLESGVHSGIQDVSIVATHVMLQAWELGVGSCWVNYFSPSALKKAFNLPENETPVLLMPMGVPAEDSEPMKLHTECKEISETVRFL